MCHFFVAGAAFGDVHVSVVVAGAAFGEVHVSLFVADAAFGKVHVSLFMPVAPRIVNDVSCFKRIDHESFFFVAGAAFGDVGGSVVLLRAL